MKRTARGVLNTRPREQAAELSGLLAAAGFKVIEAPAIETVPAWDAAELEAVRTDLARGAFDWVVLASQNAGRLLLEDLTETRVACGGATARALGLTPAVVLDRFSATVALEALNALVRPGQRILLPRAAESRTELADGLIALGAVVHAPVAYRTIAVEPSTLAAVAVRLANGDVNAVTACSPSALQSLVMAVGRESLLMTTLVCLGETTADAARRGGLRVDGVATTTTMVSLVEAVVAAVARPEVPV